MRALPLLLLLAVAAADVREYRDVPVHVEAPIAPIPVRASDGAWRLDYHLFVTNLSTVDLVVERIVAADAKDGRPVATYGEKELNDVYLFESPIDFPSRDRAASWTRATIPAGRTGGVFFFLTLPSRATVPRALVQTIIFRDDARLRIASATGMTVRGIRVSVDPTPPVVIGPPLRGGPWICGNGPAYNSAHQTLVVVDGRARMPQRFGIDFSKVDAAGHRLPDPFPDEITNAMFFGYGAQVIAVADGVVERVVDGIPENVPQVSGKIVPAVPITKETVSGNWVAVKIAPHRWAFFAHLQPGRIRVHVGQHVKRGQLIGLLGNSGNAVGPHLHFQVSDALADSLNANEGVPYVFDSYEQILPGGKTTHRARVIPLNGEIVRF